MKAAQLEFPWLQAADATAPNPAAAIPPVAHATPVSLAELQPPSQPPEIEHPILQSEADTPDGPPVPLPLPAAVAAGVFGQTVEGPVEPDEEEVAAITTEHANAMILMLADLDAVTEAARTGHDPQTGRLPRTPEAQAKLAENLKAEERRLTSAYADALAAYAEAFGDGATARLDEWVRQAATHCDTSLAGYPPTHPWHFYHAGDNAEPVAPDDIPMDEQAGEFLARDLPKSAAKRLVKLREWLPRECEQLATDRRRYVEIVECGAEALSRYDREIAHTSDAMARASALALKFRHVSLGLGRVAWIEAELRRLGAHDLFVADSDAHS